MLIQLPPAVVTQNELAYLTALLNQRAQICAQIETAAQEVFGKLAAGGQVEPGTLDALIGETKTPAAETRYLMLNGRRVFTGPRQF